MYIASSGIFELVYENNHVFIPYILVNLQVYFLLSASLPCILSTGTKSEMLRMEKAYINGEYTPFEELSK